jgi:hypothetical protein
MRDGFFRRAAYSSAACLAILVLSSPAFAQRGYDYGHAERVVRDGVIQRVNQRIDQMENAIVEALRLHSGQRLEENQRMIRALENLFSTQDGREVERRLSDARFQAARQSSPSPLTCNIITGVGASASAPIAIAVAREQRVGDVMEFMTGSTTRTRSAEGVSAGMIQRIEETCSTDATADMVASGVCASVRKSEPISPALNANVMIGRAVHSRDDSRSTALFTATALGRPVGPLPANVAQRPDAVEFVAQLQTSAARQSAAATVLADIAARRRPIENEELRRWAEGTAPQVLGYRLNNNFPEGVSAHAALELRANQWFNNPQWLAQIDTNPQMAPRSAAQILAFLAHLGFEQYRQLEMMNMNLALLLSLTEEGTRVNRQ